MIKRLLPLLLFALPVFAAPGACPSNAQYINRSNPTGALVTLASYGITGCYYISASTSGTGPNSPGSDSNTGTDESHPWLHSPGMNNCSSVCAGVSTNTAGIGFIFRGGDTWHAGNSGATPYMGIKTSCYNNGTLPGSMCLADLTNPTIANPLYIGVDKGWFAGGSWVRPIFTGDNPACNANTANGTTCVSNPSSNCTPGGGASCTGMFYVSSCAFQTNSVNNLIELSFTKNVIIDNLELTGLCQSHVGQPGGDDVFVEYGSAQAPLTFENLYIHNMSHLRFAAPNGQPGCTGSTVCAVASAFFGSVNNGAVGETILKSTVDFSDSDPVGVGLCFHGFYNVAFNTFRYTSQCLPDTLKTFHDNLYENFYENGHSNVIESANTSGVSVVYNNVFRHLEQTLSSGAGVFLWLGPTATTDTVYAFGNIAYDVGPMQYLNIGGLGITTNSGNYIFFNNTWQTNSGQVILACQLQSTGSTTTINDHYIDDGNPFIGCPHLTNTTHLVMTNAQATSGGYISGTNPAYAPQTAGAATVGTGTNKQSICTTLSGSADALIQAAGTACQFSTTYGGAITATSRPISTVWDIGAFQFGGGGGPVPAATPTYSPSTGSYTIPQTVTISSTTGAATICYTSDGTVPTANGSGTCTHGFTLSNGSPVTVTFTTLLQAVASASGFLDSAVGSALYTFPNTATGTMFARREP